MSHVASEDLRAIQVSRGADGIRVALSRPPVNAFTTEMFQDLVEALKALHKDPRPLLIHGLSGIFSAGFDIKTGQAGQAAALDAARACICAVNDYPAPTIAAVEGAAVGVGLLIATSVDILVTSRTARLRMPEVTLGITSDVEPLRRYLSEPWIRRVCLTGEALTAEQLHLDSAGAILCEPGAATENAETVLASLSEISPTALCEMKRRLHE